MQRKSRVRLAALLVCACLLLSAAPISSAQSGRRPPKQPRSPDPLPPKQEEPPIKPSSQQDSKPQIPVKLVRSSYDINISTFYSQAVEDGCLERLSRSIVKASSAGEQNRKVAIDIAKGSTDTYVLWFELRVDPVDAQLRRWQPQYLQVWYEVFIPVTGKSKAGGHVYQRPQGPGGLPIPGPGSPSSAEYSLKYAGREMADRLLDFLNLPHPPPIERRQYEP